MKTAGWLLGRRGQEYKTTSRSRRTGVWRMEGANQTGGKNNKRKRHDKSRKKQQQKEKK